jgi:hypothetical protein
VALPAREAAAYVRACAEKGAGAAAASIVGVVEAAGPLSLRVVKTAGRSAEEPAAAAAAR